jgi:hypothetical protein
MAPEAEADLARLDNSVKPAFAKHIRKLETAEPRKFPHGGARYSVETVGQGRLVCAMNDGILEILHLFATHKEYEKWYRGQK